MKLKRGAKKQTGMILRTYKYRLKPKSTAATFLEETLETHRRLYNEMLEARIHAYEVYGAAGSISFFDQSRWITVARKRNKFLQKCNRSALTGVAMRLERAFQNFFRRCKDPTSKKKGFPKFKARGELNSITFSVKRHSASEIGCNGAMLRFPAGCQKKAGLRISAKEGYVTSPVVWHRGIPPDGKPKTLTVARDGSHWFLCISIEIPKPPASCGSGKIGVDVGLSSFVTTSDGDAMGTSRIYEDSRNKLRVAQRHASRCKRGSKRSRRAKEKVATIHRKIRNRRKHHHFDVANSLVDKNSMIAIESLCVRGMVRNKKLSRRIYDAGWTSFKHALKSVAELRGASVIEVDAAGTSQQCSACGETVRKGLSVRVHRCPHCGLAIDRDVNAARNVLSRALQNTGGGRPAGDNVGGHPVRCLRNHGEPTSSETVESP